MDDHPDNPRLVFRQDVIDAIAANLDGRYPQKHAIHYLYLAGDDSEDHLAHAAWNILGVCHFEEALPEMIDIPTRADGRKS